MQREQFNDVLARAAAICNSQPLIIFDSQSVHATTTTPPSEVLLSVECDVWTRDPGEAASLEQDLGKDSEYAREKGVYADPLPPELPTLPSGWEQRLVSEPVIYVRDILDESRTLILNATNRFHQQLSWPLTDAIPPVFKPLLISLGLRHPANERLAPERFVWPQMQPLADPEFLSEF